MRTDVLDVSFPGFADEGFGPVADAFADNFRRGAEMGAACAVHHDGRLVVDLHGGIADADHRQAVGRQTPSPSASRSPRA